ncbi:D-psicose/D-tagatose/L-ribulose 3-epimerase [Spirosomataceae bacterium TFI 002]|nr:D-psicose/D-tagatose/L-ribulose 3-epimerase [Spirosomataceae bacterium TFI 002]
MIKIGFNVLAWSANVSPELFPIIDRIKKIGYDGVEFFVGAEDIKNYKIVGDHSKDLGLDVTCVTVVSPDANPVSDDAANRARGLDRVKWAIDRTHELGANVLCGPFHSAHAYFYGRPATQDELKWAAENMHKAGEHAQEAGVTLALEALNRFECYLVNTMADLAKLVTNADHPNVKAMFDTHHANIEEKKYADALLSIAPHLHHIHISENDRGTPGSGHIPFDDAFAAFKNVNYNGWLTIEAFSRSDPEFANAINVWREYDEAWDIAEKGFAFIKEKCEKHGLALG